MKIDHLRIHNYKSLVDFELINPNPFTVFVGPNASGKSNIFEALEFLSYYLIARNVTSKAFGGMESYYNYGAFSRIESLRRQANGTGIKHNYENDIRFTLNEKGDVNITWVNSQGEQKYRLFNNVLLRPEFKEQKYSDVFSRIFAGKSELVRIKNTSSEKLQIDASNLETVLKRILQNEIIQEEFVELCELFIPEFENISIHSDNVSGIDTLLIKEKFTDKPFTKNLLSDGTFNILALLTAVYQSDEPQFLCIEEPENGLNPYVIEELIHFFREMCKQKGHIIWLNTHSQTLVRHLESHEIILIDKKEGITKAKQIHDFERGGLTMDQAWLSNAIGGGLPW